ncbi:MAG TPA: AAA family ATPase [Herpetosiphonaceae bacterium]
MRTVAITNLKGGVGKTTTVVNLGAGLSLKGLRVLLVDVDAQGNLATALGVRPRRTLYEVLVDGKPAAQCIVQARPNLDLLAADDTLMSAQPLITQRPDWAHLLTRALRPLAAEYDVALIDCSASLSVMNVNALMATRDVLTPTIIEPLALRGIELLERQLQRIGTGTIRCIIPTMFDGRQRQANTLLANLRSQYGRIVTEPIRVNVRLSEAPAVGRTIYEHDPRSRGALDYAQLVEHIATVFDLRPRMPAPTPPAARERPRYNLPPSPAPAQAQHNGGTANGQEAPLFQGPTHEPCPTCRQPLQQTVLAGYRVRYCNHCHYKRQELVQGVRR